MGLSCFFCEIRWSIDGLCVGACDLFLFSGCFGFEFHCSWLLLL